jgi:hypothetical protein
MHHLWLVMRFGRDRETLVIGPRTLSQRRTRVEEVGAERVALGLRELPARHWAVRDQAGGALLWEVWTDTAGRLLRVLDPRTSLEAIRDEPPA